MKRLLVAVLIFLLTMTGCIGIKQLEKTGASNAPSPWKVTNGVVAPVNDGWSVAMGSSSLTAIHVTALPASPTAGMTYWVDDATSACVLGAGGGGVEAEFKYDGSAWVGVLCSTGTGLAIADIDTLNELNGILTDVDLYSVAQIDALLGKSALQAVLDLEATDSPTYAGMTLNGAGGLELGAAGSVQGTARWYSNTPANLFRFDFFGANYTENVGWRAPVAMPTVLNALVNVDVTTGQIDYTDPATFLLSAGTDNIKDTHLDWGTGATQISAADIPIADGTSQFTATNVEAALDELHDAVESGTGYTNLTSFVAQTPWRVFYSNTDGDVVELALGGAGTYLQSNGAALAPTWVTPAGTGDVTAVGDCTTGDCTMDAAMDSVDISPTSGTWDLSALTSLVIPGLKNGATSAGFLRLYEDSDNGTSYYDIIGPAALAANGSIQTTEYGWSLVGVANEAALKTLINAEAGVDFQAYDADLTTWGGITPSANLQTFLTTPTAANLETAMSAGAYFSDIAAATSEANFKSITNLERSDTGAMDTVGSFAAPTTTNPYSLPAANCYGATVYYGATGEIDLPAGVDGMNVIIYNTGAFTITIDPNASEVITRDGTAQTGGVSMTLSSGAGNYVALIFDGTQWVTKGFKGTLAVGT